MIRPTLAFFGAIVVMMLCFTAGRSCERRQYAGQPPRVDTVTVTEWRDRYLEPPSGPRPDPVYTAHTDTVLDIRIAGCQSTTPSPSLPIVRPVETMLAVERRGDVLRVSRITEERRGQMNEYRIPERANRFYVGAQGGEPVVVGDRWWWLRDVEVLGFGGAAGAYLGGKAPISERFSVMGGRGSEGDFFLGAAWRPFVNWP